MTSAFFAASLLAQPMVGRAATAPAAPAPGAPAPTAPAPAPAADVQQPYYGLLNDDNVYLRSGPSEERYYACAKLSKGAKLTVVSAKEDWLKVIPPEGSFCYVAKAYVEKRGDGSVGRVTKPNLNVRSGSQLNSLKTTVQTSLEEGDDVKIVGEEAEYFKIVPPPGAYLYVKKTFVDPMPAVAVTAPPVAPVVPVPTNPNIHYPLASEPIPPVVGTEPVGGEPRVAGAPSTTQPAGTAVTASNTLAPSTTQPTVVVNAEPTTKPVEPTAEAKFNELEDAFLDSTRLPLDQQPIDQLISQYTTLKADPSLSSSMRRLADRRVAMLKVKLTARKDLLETQQKQAEAKEREASLRAENDELKNRIKETDVKVYSALGTLRLSSLQQSGATLYRLTDPGSGRTLLYIRSNDAKYTDLLNKFIGVDGDITEDSNMNLKVIVPKATDVVDPAKVNANVTATVMPPSMLPKTSTASVVGN
jgi:hypothetical protein